LKTEIDTRYGHGRIPPNKGKKGYYPPQIHRKGKKLGRPPAHALPIGTEKIDSCGYMRIKIDNVLCDCKKNWKAKHQVIWEDAHGPVPKGHIIIFADGNKLNFDLNNLLLVSRNEVAIINHEGLISSDPDLTKTGLLVARLKLLTNKRVRELKEVTV
jgi:hypothetical protein